MPHVLIVELLGHTKETEQQMQTSVFASQHLSGINQVLFGKKIWQNVTNFNALFTRG